MQYILADEIYNCRFFRKSAISDCLCFKLCSWNAFDLRKCMVCRSGRPDLQYIRTLHQMYFPWAHAGTDPKLQSFFFTPWHGWYYLHYPLFSIGSRTSSRWILKLCSGRDSWFLMQPGYFSSILIYWYLFQDFLTAKRSVSIFFWLFC